MPLGDEIPTLSQWAPSGHQGRHHVDESIVQKAVSVKVGFIVDRYVGLVLDTFAGRVLSHGGMLLSLLIEDGYDIRTVQEPLGHKDVRTTMVYTHVLNKGCMGVRSPMDSI